MNGWSFTPTIPDFNETPGPKVELPVTGDDFVKLFLTDELIKDIKIQTNLYARQYIETQSYDESHASRVNGWYPVTDGDIINHITLSLLIGINQLPSVPDYWSKNPLFHNPVFGAIMSRNRYQIIAKFFHFNDNSLYDRTCLLYTSPSPRDGLLSRMPSSA